MVATAHVQINIVQNYLSTHSSAHASFCSQIKGGCGCVTEELAHVCSLIATKHSIIPDLSNLYKGQLNNTSESLPSELSNNKHIMRPLDETKPTFHGLHVCGFQRK